jgi:hypothetical protein
VEREQDFSEFSDFEIINYLIVKQNFERNLQTKEEIEKYVDAEVPRIMEWLLGQEKLDPLRVEADKLRAEFAAAMVRKGDKRFIEEAMKLGQKGSEHFLHIKSARQEMPRPPKEVSAERARDLVIKKLALHMAYYDDLEFPEALEEVRRRLRGEPLSEPRGGPRQFQH